MKAIMKNCLAERIETMALVLRECGVCGAIFLFQLCALCPGVLSGQVIIPSPEKMETKAGEFSLHGKEMTLYAEAEVGGWLAPFRQALFPDIPLRQSGSKKKANVRFFMDAACPSEAYRLCITPQYIEVRAADRSGFIHAVQTLRQWQHRDEAGHPAFGCVEIADRPRVGWRSFMLDSGRQYQSVSTIKKYIDMASMLKMNRFHWHLTEGLGWRVEIKRYPLLTEKGSRAGTGGEQQGFYTQEEIGDIVAYAAERGITVVPEIDMPGHAEAALSAYPELGCFGLPVEIPKSGFTQNIFCAGKDSTLQFLKNVLDEVCALFPSPYIHLGGDEAPKGNWDKCPDCRKRISEQGLEDSHDLQLWFSAQMARHLQSKGRKAIFWGDVIYKDGYPLPGNVVIQWWNYRGRKDLALRNALRHGYPVICSTNTYMYLNFPLTPWRGYAKDRTFDLEDAYLRNPSYAATLDPNPLVWGMGCALWTDDGVKEHMIDQRLFPRILVLAEQMWHRGNLPDFQTFHQAVLQKKAWFESQGYAFGPALTEEVTDDYRWE